MILKAPKDLKAPTNEATEELFKRLTEWRDDPVTVSGLNYAALETLKWLKGNRVPKQWLAPSRVFSELPEPNKLENSDEWWPTLKKYNDDAMQETRRIFLRQRAYDLGLLCLLKNLSAAGLIMSSATDAPLLNLLADEVLMPSTYFGLNQLLSYSRLKVIDEKRYKNLLPKISTEANDKRGKSQVSTLAVAELFGIVSEHRTKLFRKKLARLGSVGIVARLPTTNGWEIELGPVGVAFFMHVYLPIIDHMSLQGVSSGVVKKGVAMTSIIGSGVVLT